MESSLVLQSVEEQKTWLLILCANVSELSGDLDTLTDVTLLELLLCSRLNGTSAEYRSEDMLGW